MTVRSLLVSPCSAEPLFIVPVSCVSVCLCKQSWLDEWLWTFLLVLVVFSVASSKRDTNAYFGLAIGSVILASDFFFAKLSGGMFNPGVGTGVCAVSLFNGQPITAIWIYWVRRSQSGLPSRAACAPSGAVLGAGGALPRPVGVLIFELERERSGRLYVELTLRWLYLVDDAQTACPFGGACAALADKFLFPDVETPKPLGDLDELQGAHEQFQDADETAAQV